jgi:serine protease
MIVRERRRMMERFYVGRILTVFREFWLAAGSAVLLNSAAFAATISVPADQPTIQDAINFAADGDTVSVAAGTYAENLDFAGKSITVESQDGPFVTIVDGGGTKPVVFFSGGETRTSIVRGFTITNGWGMRGGGIAVQLASPTIEDNIISGNIACTGSGIGVNDGSPLIQRNQIVSNSRGVCSGGYGGGISIFRASDAEIYENYIAGNSVYFGAGIALNGGGSPIVARNEIAGNSAFSQGGGIWIVNGSDVLVTNNLIHGNTAVDGSAIYWSIPPFSPKLRFNTIYDNSASGRASVYTHGFDGAGEITSNIIVAPAGQTAIYCADFNDTDMPLFAANNVQAPGGPLYEGLCVDQSGSNGNVSIDSMFVDAANGDFRIRGNSPLIDAGLDDPDVTVDFLSNARAVDGNADQIAVSDIGAYEGIPPNADAGFDVSINASDTGTLDGSGSSDVDGLISSYRWTQTSGSVVTLSDSATVDPTFTAPAFSGLLVFELLVTDDLGFIDVDEVRVTVNGPAPPPPTPKGSGGGGSADHYLIMLLLMFALRIQLEALVITLRSGCAFLQQLNNPL